MTNSCELELFNTCFVNAISNSDKIFGFSEFLSGLALLVIVYTITDFKYKFRVSVAPINLPRITFISIGIIGAGTLISEIWPAKQWLTPEWNFDKLLWQAIFAAMFLILVLIWIYFAFLKRSTFNHRNHMKFSASLYSIILRGRQSELDTLSYEISSSIENIIKTANNPEALHSDLPENHEIYFANEMILLLGNKKFCESIAKNSPSTAIIVFDTLADQQQFFVDSFETIALNLSTAFIKNKESQLYYEEEGYTSGLLGYIKPISNSLYGNYYLMNSLSNRLGPLDIRYEDTKNWDHEHLKKYSQVVTVCFKSFLKEKQIYCDNAVFNRAFQTIKNFAIEIASIDRNSSEYYLSENYKKFQVVVDFAKDLVEALNEYVDLSDDIILRVRDFSDESLCDKIAEIHSEIIHSAAYINAPTELCWSIQHNNSWSRLLDSLAPETEAQKIISHKVRRKIYNEILNLNKYPTYKGARYLGYCLNVLWVKNQSTTRKDPQWPLRQAMKNWLKINFSNLYNDNKELAEACLMSSISYDEEHNAIIKTYRSWPGKEAPRDIFYLK